MGETKIEWAEKTWNPVEGCTKVSAGCKFCYAERIAPRLKVDFSRAALHPERLDEPVRWRKPRRIFVCSRSDLFHPSVTFPFIARVWDRMFDAKHHTFLILTKRPERLLAFSRWMRDSELRRIDYANVWLGVSVENQKEDWRIQTLLQVEAVIRFVSYEPALGPLELDFSWLPQKCAIHNSIHADGHDCNQSHWDAERKNRVQDPPPPFLSWVIAGGESGPHYRPMDLDWLSSIVAQCRDSKVPLFVKQDSGPRPGRQGRIPDDLWKIKEYPR